MSNRLPLLLLVLLVSTLSAQEQPDSRALLLKVLQRLDALETENQQLVQEVHSLREQVASASKSEDANVAADVKQAPAVEERVAVNENRIAEQAQTKVEASQRFPVTLTGTLLFNSFLNTSSPASSNYTLLTGPGRSGATLRQTLLGFRFTGPSLPGGGQVHGSLMMDFGSGYSEPGASWLRLRRGNISLDWENRSFSVGQDKPLISPYQPDSLAEVVVPPLSGAGNLWLWLPQARYEERLHLGANSGITAQIAAMQTDEKYQIVSGEDAYALQAARPAVEGRLAFWHKTDDNRRIEIAPGFHVSTTRVAESSAKSRLGSLDWKAVPWWKLELSGTVYRGQNAASLGALGNGFSILQNGTVRPVTTSGGWAQVSLPLTNRLNLHVFSGLEDDRGKDLAADRLVRNFTYASNLMYRLGPNVMLSFEALHMRARLVSGAAQNQTHYDLALGYLF